MLAPSSPYPFGLIMGPSGRYLYVSTVNMGEIFVIDTDPGPTYLQIVKQHATAAFNGRLATYNGKLIIPGLDFTIGAVLSIMDLNQARLNLSLEIPIGGDPGLEGRGNR